MSNRTQCFVRRIIQNSKLNREKFVYNKNIYMINSVMRKNSNTNYSVVKKRNFHTTHQNPGGGGPEGGPNMLLVALGCAISLYFIKFTKSR